MNSCTQCGKPMLSWGSRSTGVLSIDSNGMPVRQQVQRRRWRCASCGIVKAEPAHARGGLVSHELRDKVAQSCFQEGFAGAGRKFGIDEKTARSLWNEWSEFREVESEVPFVLGMHVVTITGQECTLLTDAEKMTVVELIEDTSEGVSEWLKTRGNNISEVIIGFCSEHKNLVEKIMPHVKISIMPNHVESALIKIWESVFFKLKNEYPNKRGDNFCENIDLFSTRRKNISNSDNENMESWRTEFLDAYDEREDILENIENAQESIWSNMNIIKLRSSRAALLLQNWKTEILNGRVHGPSDYGKLVCVLTSSIDERKPKLSKALMRGLILLIPERYTTINESAVEEGLEEETSIAHGVLISSAVSALTEC